MKNNFFNITYKNYYLTNNNLVSMYNFKML